MSHLMKEITVILISCVCAHVSFMKAYSVCFNTWVCNPPWFTWALCSEQRLSIHVALLPTFIYVEAVTSRINPLLWRLMWFLLLSLFVNAIMFPCGFGNFAKPLVCASHTAQLLLTSCVLIMHSIVFGSFFSVHCSVWMILNALNMKGFRTFLCVTGPSCIESIISINI